MSWFGRIRDSIFGKAQPKPAATPAAAPQAAPAAAPATAAPAAAAPVAPVAPPEPVDVEAILTQLAADHGQGLNWRTSIVDLMKLLGLDSSLQNRRELADELGYTGAKDGSAEMNIWLQKAVMRKLAENGATVPPELTH